MAAGILALASSLQAQAGAQCDGTVVPGRGFVKAGGIYQVHKGGTTYLCVACGSCRAMPSGSAGSASSGSSTRSMIGSAVLGGFLSGLQQGLANAQAERERETARQAARREAERIEAERKDAEQRLQFEQTKTQTLSALKGFHDSNAPAGLPLKAATAPPSDGPALRAARCAAQLGQAVRTETGADSARALSERALQDAGSGDCPTVAGDLPSPSSDRQLSPENAAKVRAAEALVLQLSRNDQQWKDAYARHEAALQELQHARAQARAAQQQPQDSEAQRKAQAALAAASRLEQELAELERTMQGIEQNNQQLIQQLGSVQSQRQETAAPSTTSSTSPNGSMK